MDAEVTGRRIYADKFLFPKDWEVFSSETSEHIIIDAIMTHIII
jgi:hypothetical protein